MKNWNHLVLGGAGLASLLFASVCIAERSNAKKTEADPKVTTTLPCRVLTVDIGKTYQSYYKAEAAQKEFDKTVETAQKEIQTMMDEGAKMVGELQELQTKINNPALTEDAKKKLVAEAENKAGDIRKKEQEIQQFRQETDQRLSQKNQELLDQHVKEIKVVINSIAEEKKADLVFNSTGLGVLYARPEMDVTQSIIDQINADKPKESPTEKKETNSAAPASAKAPAILPSKK